MLFDLFLTKGKKKQNKPKQQGADYTGSLQWEVSKRH